MARLALRGALSAPGLLREARKSFERIPDPVRGRKRVLADYLMSGLAVFGLKFPSLLQFDRGARDDGLIRENLKHLYGVEDAPCDTAPRERLDEVEPSALRGAFKRLFAVLQRGK
ncbi:MAG: transposase, partial [Gammaproteobacteria bacterium]|nr:transposase [Gammaproteobacteria bacterium]